MIGVLMQKYEKQKQKKNGQDSLGWRNYQGLTQQ